jgi:hypothetical protein
MADPLRTNLIRLAHENPDLRDQILPVLKQSSDDDLAKQEEEANAYLAANLESLPRGFWMPPHNLALNFALMGANLWRFTILPYGWQRTGYRQSLNGIIIHPIWTSVGDGRALGTMNMSGFSYLTMDVAKKLVAAFKDIETIPETVKKELVLLEKHFNIEIPGNVEGPLIVESVKVAKRRWNVDRMRVKNRLIPLDGSKPRDLGSWE